MIIKKPTDSSFTECLFWERCYANERQNVCFTLKERDHEGYPSLYRLYLEMGDPTEFTFATTYFVTYDQWLRIANNGLLAPYVNKMRRDLEAKLKSEALARIVATAKKDGNSPISLAANKYLLDTGFGKLVGVKEKKKGRPPKSEIADKAEELLKAYMPDIEEKEMTKQ